MPLELHYGGAVAGAQCFPRPELEERFLRTLTSSAGIKMFGLRRIGKSTFRRHATDHFDSKGRPYAYVDGQGLHSLTDLVSKLFLALPSNDGLMARTLGFVSAGPAKAALEALGKGSEYEEKIVSIYWQLVSEAIKKALKSAGARPVLVIDEFSYLIDNMIRRDDARGRADADKLLASMREWRDLGMPMLLTGSLGMTGLARKHGLNGEHLNDLQPFDVPELSEAEARDFIRQATEVPSQGRWTVEHTEEFLKQSGVLYPSFLVRGLLEIGVENPPPFDEFAAIFAERIRPHLHADFYRQFDRRFSDYAAFPKDEQRILIVPALKAVMEAESCAHGDIPCSAPFSRIDLARTLLILVEDGFVHFSEDADGERHWKPASRLAKLWWNRAGLA